jgi:hypothetical protein
MVHTYQNLPRRLASIATAVPLKAAAPLVRRWGGSGANQRHPMPNWEAPPILSVALCRL